MKKYTIIHALYNQMSRYESRLWNKSVTFSPPRGRTFIPIELYTKIEVHGRPELINSVLVIRWLFRIM